MSENNKKCLLCEKEYNYCPQCGHKAYDLWKITFCSANCKEIFQTCVDYNLGAITLEDAKKKLDKCDLKGKENFNADIKKILEEIYPVQQTVIKETDSMTASNTRNSKVYYKNKSKQYRK